MKRCYAEVSLGVYFGPALVVRPAASLHYRYRNYGSSHWGIFVRKSSWLTLSAPCPEQRLMGGADGGASGKLFKEAGLECDTKLLASSSKVLSSRKPLQQPKPAATQADTAQPQGSHSPQTAGEECAEEICVVPAS
jgi:hypothetical protein